MHYLDGWADSSFMVLLDSCTRVKFTAKERKRWMSTRKPRKLARSCKVIHVYLSLRHSILALWQLRCHQACFWRRGKVAVILAGWRSSELWEADAYLLSRVCFRLGFGPQLHPSLLVPPLHRDLVGRRIIRQPKSGWHSTLDKSNRLLCWPHVKTYSVNETWTTSISTS